MGPNPRNCSTCAFSTFGEQVFCAAPTPNFVARDLPRTVPNPEDACDAHKAQKGTFIRMCLNCGQPIRTHHKFTFLGDKRWIHKCCAHPDSYSVWHYETYGKRHENASVNTTRPASGC